MDNILPELSIRKTFVKSLSFVIEFFKRYWIVLLFYFILDTVVTGAGLMLEGHRVPGSPSVIFKLRKLILDCSQLLVNLIMRYFAVRMMVSKLDPSLNTSNKSAMKLLWQMTVIDLVTGVSVLFSLLLFIVPGIWLAVRTNVSLINALSTNEGAIQSIKESFKLTKNNFWLCFKFLFPPTAIIMALVVIGILIFSLAPESGFSLYAEVSLEEVFSVLGFIINIVFYYFQTDLYVYLKRKNVAVI